MFLPGQLKERRDVAGTPKGVPLLYWQSTCCYTTPGSPVMPYPPSRLFGHARQPESSSVTRRREL